jgi:uncharacterized protein
MKPSFYNIFVDNQQTNQTIIFNALYGGLTIWEAGEMEAVRHILSNPTLEDGTDASIRQVLINQKNLINDDVDEIAIIRNRKKCGIEDKNRLDLVIMPTLDCNFACVYCYETHRPSKMNAQTEIAIKKWLSEQIPHFKFIMLHWFGGEPLLGFDHVVSITRHVVDIANQSGAAFAIHMTTNGYLLNQKRISVLIECGIMDFQITVDGAPETHDAFRVLKNGKGTFQRLQRNIIMAARAHEQIKITLRVNFNHHNLHTIPTLLELFPTDVRPHLRIIFEPIFGQCDISATDNIAAGEISQSTATYYAMAKNMGYDVVLVGSGLSPGKLVYCYAERANQYIVNYNGDIYKCSVSKFVPEERLGYLTDGGKLIPDDPNRSQWLDMDPFEPQCLDCVYLPLCMGGCRRMRIEKRGTGSFCSLIPTNTSYLLKQVAFGDLDRLILERLRSSS